MRISHGLFFSLPSQDSSPLFLKRTFAGTLTKAYRFSCIRPALSPAETPAGLILFCSEKHALADLIEILFSLC